MKSFLLLILAAVMLLANSASAADSQARIGAPVLGYIWDPAAKGIRPILGTPGASTMGDPLDLGGTAEQAAISPRQDFAIVATGDAMAGDDPGMRIVALQPGVDSQILAGAASDARRIIFSPNGQAAGLYRQGAGRLQIFAHLPQAPVLAHEIDMAGLAGDLVAAAISDDGDLALMAIGDGNSSTTWLSFDGSGPVQIEGPAAIAAISFQSGGRNAVAATRDGAVYLLQDLPARNFQALAAADARTADPVAVQFSADGERVYVAGRQGVIAGFGVRSQEATFLSCGCQPSGLFPLQPRMLMRLNEISDGPLMLLDTSQAGPRTWFVPAVIATANAGRAQ
jgi:hypothetical protein